MTIAERLAQRAHDEIMARSAIVNELHGGTVTLEFRLDERGLVKRVSFRTESVSDGGSAVNR